VFSLCGNGERVKIVSTESSREIFRKKKAEKVRDFDVKWMNENNLFRSEEIGCSRYKFKKK
jgi:hypothetical protein